MVDPKDNCITCLTQFDPKRELHRIGKTKVYMAAFFFFFYKQSLLILIVTGWHMAAQKVFLLFRFTTFVVVNFLLLLFCVCNRIL